ncbi:MAG: hypothetical protein LUB57_07755, partial [Cloacibacillus porcorum]|nr:hypothetical protein [Cloacibacillus porcorum]
MPEKSRRRKENAPGSASASPARSTEGKAKETAAKATRIQLITDILCKLFIASAHLFSEIALILEVIIRPSAKNSIVQNTL